MKTKAARILSILLTLCVVSAATSVTISADSEAAAFSDVSRGDWYYDAVIYCYEFELMNGTGGLQFSPSNTLTRAMAVTILYRFLGSPSASGLGNPFTDVPNNEWYSDAVKWMSMMGYVNGYGDSLFGLEDDVTKEQAATMLYRVADEYALEQAYTMGTIGGVPYTDLDKLSDWAYGAVVTLNDCGIFSYIPGVKFNPQASATRAEMASILYGFYAALIAEDGYSHGYNEDEGVFYSAGDMLENLLMVADHEDLMFISADPESLEYLTLEDTVEHMVDTHRGRDDERILLTPLKDGVYISIDIVNYEDFFVEDPMVENISELYVDAGETVMLFAPLRGIPNVMVTVEWGPMRAAWHNSLDSTAGEIGTEWVTGYYYEDYYGDDNSEFTEDFFHIIQNLCEETMNHFKQGMVAVWLEDYVIIEGEACWTIAIGTDHEEHFVTEFIYAVGQESKTVYRFDVLEDEWVGLPMG